MATSFFFLFLSKRLSANQLARFLSTNAPAWRFFSGLRSPRRRSLIRADWEDPAIRSCGGSRSDPLASRPREGSRGLFPLASHRLRRPQAEQPSVLEGGAPGGGPALPSALPTSSSNLARNPQSCCRAPFPAAGKRLLQPISPLPPPPKAGALSQKVPGLSRALAPPPALRRNLVTDFRLAPLRAAAGPGTTKVLAARRA